MDLGMPDTLEELEEAADDLGALLDSMAAATLDGGPPLERLIVGVLDQVETEIRHRLAAVDAPMSRDRVLATAGR